VQKRPAARKKGQALDRVELLGSLSRAFGVSGDEQEVMDILEKILRERCRISRDRFGNRIFFKRGSRATPKVVVAAHADEVGFMVQAVHPKGYLFVVPLGGWSPLTVSGMAVQVKSRKGLVEGMIGAVPPHHRSKDQETRPPSWEEIWVDIGAAGEEEARNLFGVLPGDRVQPVPRFRSLAGGRVLMGKAWDDRVGCALLTELLVGLEDTGHPNSLMGVVTVQEEIGSRGAQVLAGQLEADVLIVLEGAPADDFPLSPAWQNQSTLGRGVQIRAHDPSMLVNRGLRDFIVGLADQEGVPYQVAVRRSGATDGGVLHRAGGGIPGIVLSVPVRYAHNGVGLIDLGDYGACLRLLISALKTLSRDDLPGFLP